MGRAEDQKAVQEKRLEQLAGKAKEMESVVLDGHAGIAYFVGKHPLEIGETVVSVPFSKLIILLGQLCQNVIAPLFAGARPEVRGGGGPEKPSLKS